VKEGRKSNDNAPDAAVGFLPRRKISLRIRAEWGSAGCGGGGHVHRGIRAEVEGILNILQV
jgi:hypothetical protein